MVRLLISLLTIGIIFFLLLPAFLATETGQKLIQTVVTEKYSQNVELNDVKLRWFGPQSVQQIKFLNPEEPIALNNVVVHETLFSSIFSDRKDFLTKDHWQGEVDAMILSLADLIHYLKIDTKIPEKLQLLFGNFHDFTGPIEQMTFSLSPIHFSFNKGIVTIERVELMAMERYPFALWGSVDLVNDQVEMKLEVPTKILGKGFALNLSGKQKSFLVEIKGNHSNLTFDQRALTKELGNMTLQFLKEMWNGKGKEE